MKIRKYVVPTVFVASAMYTTYVFGYLHGVVDTAEVLNPIYEERDEYRLDNAKLQVEVNKLSQEVSTLNNKLSQPVALQRADVSFNDGVKVAEFKISAYSPYDDKNYINSDGSPNSTATGTKPGPGTFAVDPTVIPYGSKITIIYPDGTIERGVAEDTGGAIKNNRIDVFRWTFDGAIEFGMQDAVVLWEGGE